MTDHDCPLNFKHSECSQIFSHRDKRPLGWVFKASDGLWNYIDTDRGETPLPSGIVQSRQAAINWLRLGDHTPDPHYAEQPDGPPDYDPEPPPNWEP